ncbi:MAG: DUF423 domain-containing protein [Cytophagaceae bacterium]|nr:DUF423 domain-containing protein [Cytophagaceae bacterium]
MQKLFLIISAVLGALSVMIGAFGAHKLKDHLAKIGRSDVFETAVKYQFYHTFALLALGLLLFKFQHKLLDYAGWCFIGGVIIFSGSLYILCLTNVGKWGAVTPIGGLLLIIGWVLMAWGIAKAF